MSEKTAPARRTQSERSSETRGRILDAAIRCLCDYGYGTTSTVRVAQMAQVSRGAMLYHFPTKRDLMFAVSEYAMDLNHDYFMTAMGEMADPLERYIRLADMRWDLALQPHGIALTEILVGSRSDDAVRAEFPKFQRALFAKQRKRLEDRAKDAALPVSELDHHVSRAIAFAIRGMAIEMMVNPDTDPEPVLGVLRDLKIATLERQYGSQNSWGRKR